MRGQTILKKLRMGWKWLLGIATAVGVALTGAVVFAEKAGETSKSLLESRSIDHSYKVDVDKTKAEIERHYVLLPLQAVGAFLKKPQAFGNSPYLGNKDGGPNVVSTIPFLNIPSALVSPSKDDRKVVALYFVARGETPATDVGLSVRNVHLITPVDITDERGYTSPTYKRDLLQGMSALAESLNLGSMQKGESRLVPLFLVRKKQHSNGYEAIGDVVLPEFLNVSSSLNVVREPVREMFRVPVQEFVGWSSIDVEFVGRVPSPSSFLALGGCLITLVLIRQRRQKPA